MRYFTLRTENDKPGIIAFIERLPEGRKYDISVTRHRVQRCLPQNRAYWLWLTCIADETGNDKDYLHRFFGEKFLPVKERVVFGEVIREPISTKKLDTAQFTQYLEKIRVFAAEEGIVLPNPGDLCWEQFYIQYKDLI